MAAADEGSRQHWPGGPREDRRRTQACVARGQRRRVVPRNARCFGLKVGGQALGRLLARRSRCSGRAAYRSCCWTETAASAPLRGVLRRACAGEKAAQPLKSSDRTRLRVRVVTRCGLIRSSTCDTMRGLRHQRAPTTYSSKKRLHFETKLISEVSARDNPRVRLARDQCIPAWALLTGGLGKAKI